MTTEQTEKGPLRGELFPFSPKSVDNIVDELKIYPLTYFRNEGLRSPEIFLARTERIRIAAQAEYSHYYRGVGIFRRLMQVEAFIGGFQNEPRFSEHILTLPCVVEKIPEGAIPSHYDKVERSILSQDQNLSTLFPALKDTSEPLPSLIGFIEAYHAYRVTFA